MFKYIGSIATAIFFIFPLGFFHPAIAKDDVSISFEDSWKKYMDEGQLRDVSGNYDDAIKSYNAALQLAESQGKERQRASTLCRIGGVLLRSGQIEKGISVLQKTRNNFTNRRSKNEQLNNIEKNMSDGLAASQTNHYDEALQSFDAARNLAIAQGDEPLEADASQCLADVNAKLRHYDEALKYYQRAKDIFNKIGNANAERIVLNKIGIIFGNLGQLQKGTDYLLQADNIYNNNNILNDEFNVKWGKLLEKSTQAFNAGHYQEALNEDKAALKFAMDQKRTPEKADALKSMGWTLNKLGQYENALDCFQQAMAIRKDYGPVTEERSILNDICDTYYKSSQSEKFRNCHKQYDDFYNIKGKEDKNFEEDFQEYMFSADHALGKHLYNNAIEIWTQAQKIAIDRGNGEEKFAFLDGMARVYVDLGEYKKALDLFQQALKISLQIAPTYSGVDTLREIGNVYELFGEYERALDYYQQDLVITRRHELTQSEGEDLLDIGGIYYHFGDYEKALDYFQQAKTVFEKNKYESVGIAINNMGNAYSHMGLYGKALDFHSQALLRQSWYSFMGGKGYIFSNIGSDHDDLRQYDDALKSYQQALDEHKKSADVNGEGYALSKIGRVYSHLGKYEKALSYYQQALVIQTKTGDIRAEAENLNYSGRTFLSLGNIDKAKENLAASAKVFESFRMKLQSEKGRSGFQKTMPDVYGDLAAAQLASAKPEEAFETIERGRAKSFLESLGNRMINEKNGKEEVSDLTGPKNEQATIDKKRDQAPLVSNDRGEIIQGQGVSNTDKKHIELIDEVRRSNQKIGNFPIVDSPTLKEIQSLLTPNTLMVEYFHKGEYTVSNKKINELWIFIISQNGFDFKRIEVTKDDLQSTLEKYSKLLKSKDSDINELMGISANLYKWLVEPIDGRLSKLQPSTLIIVPWSSMIKIPFASITPHSGKPLGVQQEIVIAPSAGVYRFLTERRASGRNSILALGNPYTALGTLKWAEPEVKEITSLFSRSTPIRVGLEATKRTFKDDLIKFGAPDVIHFASHGVFNEIIPELSYLALTPEGQDNGKLEMNDIFDLDLKGVSLVTLSACESGQGKLGAGDDLIGIVRGFMFAGSPSVLGSLWNVNDEATYNLMVNFYQNYVKGMSKAESLKNAQLTVMKDPKWSHPYYWSSFVLFGDWK